jgi:hypothetical protein
MQLLRLKQRQKEKATHIEDTQSTVTEIEMFKVVLYCIWWRGAAKEDKIPLSLQQRYKVLIAIYT